MKPYLATAAVCLGLAVTSAPALAATYSDATLEGSILTMWPHLDISSVQVNNTATTLSFKINLVGNPVTTDWGKYLIGIDSISGGDTAGNGWNRPIGMSSGMDYFVGSWVDSGNGAEIRTWNGTSWTLQSATYNPNPDSLAISKDASSVTLTFDMAGLGLSSGNTFLFDIYSSGGGGGDSAIDALFNPNQTVADWPNNYNSGNLVGSYTIQPIPEPSTLALAGLGLLVLLSRRAK
jgi:hypothetical protein